MMYYYKLLDRYIQYYPLYKKVNGKYISLGPGLHNTTIRYRELTNPILNVILDTIVTYNIHDATYNMDNDSIFINIVCPTIGHTLSLSATPNNIMLLLLKGEVLYSADIINEVIIQYDEFASLKDNINKLLY